MRGLTLLQIMLALALVGPAAAQAQSTAPAPAPALPTPAQTGGAAFDDAAPDPFQPLVAGTKAVRLPNGLAAAPADAPERVQAAIWAANQIVGMPYRYGGGHTRTFKDSGYDCSGAVSFALKGARMLRSPLASGSFMSWSQPGKGTWISVYAHGGHAYAVIAGLRLDTSSAGEPVSSGAGPRWRTNARAQAGFVVRHPKGY